MPSRWASLGILVFWAVASVGLIVRDVLPDLLIGPPPDFRAIAAADRQAGPCRWRILVADDRASLALRAVGRALTNSTTFPDGRLRLDGKVVFSRDLLKGTRFTSDQDVQIEIESTCDVDPSGNLKSFRAVMFETGVKTPLVTIDGEYRNHAIDVHARSDLPILNFTKSFPYEPKTLLQTPVTPIDRLPGLAVGQRWESKVINPLSGNPDRVTAEVTKRTEIFWNNGTVATLEILQKFPPAFSARTWVRKSDGLVLRQEMPLPFVTLVIEREPDQPPNP